uniref:Uncharacterized protein n=1 Tax=Magallana gigas TaxID=29159 RepID=K1RXL6_MAGGI
MLPQGAESSPQDQSLMDIPQVITAIETGYRCLTGVTCLNETEIWMCGDDDMMKLFNIQGERVKSIQYSDTAVKLMEALYHQGTGIKMLTCEMFFLMKDFYTFPIRQPVSTYLILSTSIPKKPALICTDEYKLL